MEDITPTELQEKKLKITVSDLTLILYFNILIFMYGGRAPKGELCCAVTPRNIIIFMFDDNRTGITFCYKHVAIFAPDTPYIFGVLYMLSARKSREMF